ncbi:MULTISPECIES: hypothetical protein [unclassified Bradyrhizobium]|uniref:hypothetical protein n=1 Tax=unclassified Bradyrhizobium TaxID=2631580 RepID=UPI00339B8ADA
MAFRVRAKINTGIKQLRESYGDRDPAELEFYPSKRPDRVRSGRTVSRHFNALSIPSRHQFLLKCYGRPFTYQGIITKQYTIKSLTLLFGVSDRTLRRWVEFNIIEPPFIILKNDTRTERSYWFWHQVQPVYYWYWHLKARGLQVGTDERSKYPHLLRARTRAKRRFEDLLGIEHVDPYYRVAGKYGVIPVP